MDELEKLTIDYMAKRLMIKQDKKFMELNKEIEQANRNMLEYLKTQIPEGLSK